jgi:hypothetical protein
MTNRFLLIASFLYFGIIQSDDLLEPYMDSTQYDLFVTEVGEAVSSHPEYLSSLDSFNVRVTCFDKNDESSIKVTAE